MKTIDIKKINEYSSFVTRQGKRVKFIKYVPETVEKSKLIFLLEDKVLSCDESGKCWIINGVESSTIESSYIAFDIFVDSNMVGWINLNIKSSDSKEVVLSDCSPFVYKTYEDALRNTTEKTFKTVKIEWSE